MAPVATQNRQRSMEHRHSQMKEQGGPITDEDSVFSFGGRPALQPVQVPQPVVPAESPTVDPSQIIKFGMTKFSDYTKVCILGKGTYGEVTRCIHIPSGLQVAMKTFFFEVITMKTLIFLNIERPKRD
jgi:serine/threonine protein kinase